jgi:peptidoglycan hydrolase-like protein with peptidoglycan-binding domain
MKTYVSSLLIFTFVLAFVISPFAGPVSAAGLDFNNLNPEKFSSNKAFDRYLQKGDSGSDVTNLQKVLNSDSDTQVADSGSGSPGNETDQYGEKTKQAVIKMQKKFDLGSSFGFFEIFSGTLDDKTRAFANEQARKLGLVENACDKESKINTEAQINETQSKIQSLADKLNPMNLFGGIGGGKASSNEERTDANNKIYALGEHQDSPAPYIEKVETENGPLSLVSGGSMKITGCNFSDNNVIHLTYGDQEAGSSDGKTIEFTPEGGIQEMFDEELEKGLGGKTKEEKEKARKETLLKMKGSMDEQGVPGIPMFITVENENGVSNAYQLFFNLI